MESFLQQVARDLQHKTNGDLSRTAIDRLVFDGIIAEQETENNIRHLTHQAFSLPQVRDWYSGRMQVFNECDIIWMENNELQLRRPDRVMTDDNGHVIVVDFKFGKPRRTYARQVQKYIELLARMGYDRSQIQGYLWYVDENRIEPIDKQ